MRIKKIELKNFKRFSDLAISEIPETSKLVLLIGSNGSGKSSLFDAFDWLQRGQHKSFSNNWEDYYPKIKGTESTAIIELHDSTTIEKKGNYLVKGHNLAKKFLGRSSIRIVPRITNDANLAHISSDQDSPVNYIENDRRFINDIALYMDNIDQALREPVFSGTDASPLRIFKESIEPLNYSLLNIFGGDINTTIQITRYSGARNNEPAKLIFKKGTSEINYDLLSHGEKQVVILLINFIVRQDFYKDSIIFIDEMDCHLNTALQYSLLEEIVTRWIPEDSQLWTASHALGFIDYARKSENASTIDFDLLNFDHKQELRPLAKDKMDVYEIALPKATIAQILKGYKLVVVENQNDEYFNTALGQDGFLFLPANNNREVFLTVKSDQDKLGLRDRDYLCEDEIKKIQEKLPNLKILHFSTFENYIYHPDNIAELGLSYFNKDDYKKEITKQKNEKLLEIVSAIEVARQHYIEFKDCIKNDEKTEPVKQIINSLKSDDFDAFYPFFNMKKYFNKNCINKLRILDLSTTKWFKEKIINILNK